MTATTATRTSTPDPATAAGSAIEVYQVSHRYKERLALKSVNLQIGRGSLHGLVGPNGAGKTTLLKILSTLTPVQLGTVTVFGESAASNRDVVRRRIGFMPDGFGLYRQMTVFETLDFFGTGYGLKRTERDAAIPDLLGLLDLEGRQHDLVGSLSRGLQQRVALAKTLVHDPDVLLLDEPASGLDPRARIELMEILTALRRMGKTIVISSHILSELALVCESVTILSRGQVRYSGPIESLLAGRADENVFSVRLQGSPHDAPERLGGIAGVRAVEPCEEPSEYLLVAEPSVGASDLLAALLGLGLPLAGFGPARRHLNEAFMELTDQGIT